jgi:uncharacterized protein YbjT (DUF2867 family)
MRVMVLGPTGAVGSELVRCSVDDPRIESVLAISRRSLSAEHPKLRVIVHSDFLDFRSLHADFAEIDACFCALGVSQVTVRDPARYREITHDYVLALARVLRASNDRAHFLFVSGREIDEKSRRLYVRVKAETERDLRLLFADDLVVFRPGYIHPLRPRATPVWQDRWLGPFVFLRPLLPGHVTDTVEVASAMIHYALSTTRPKVVDNRGISAAAQQYALLRTAHGRPQK